MKTESAAAIVVTETTALLSFIKGEMPGRTGVTIVAQSAFELPGAFAERVARKVAKQDARGRRPDLAVICCGKGADAASWDARARVAESLLSMIDEGGELVIDADRDTARRALPRFLELVDKFRQRSAGSRKSVRLRFDVSKPAEKQACIGGRKETRTPVEWRLIA